MKNGCMRSCLLPICILVLPPLLVLLIFPAINNACAWALLRQLERRPLPAQTELRDTVSAAGNLRGNGDKIQYFGALLLYSELDEEQLAAHYAGCDVAPQTGAAIEAVERPALAFGALETETDFANYYVVSAMEGGSWLLSWDIRAG